jgi:hypothetical protein
MAIRVQPVIIAPVLLLLGLRITASAAEGVDPYAQPSPRYLRQFSVEGAKMFVLERFDADGNLAARTVERRTRDAIIDGPTERGLAGWRIRLRGLNPCPSESVVYNRIQVWRCADAAQDYAGAIYNHRASVVLCKTLVLDQDRDQVLPASCFLLVGGEGEPLRTVNDDDSMVFLGLATIARTPDGRSRRPDLKASQALSRSMGFQNAD